MQAQLVNHHLLIILTSSSMVSLGQKIFWVMFESLGERISGVMEKPKGGQWPSNLGNVGVYAFLTLPFLNLRVGCDITVSVSRRLTE